MSAHSTYQYVRTTAAMLRKLLQGFERREKDLFAEEKERLASQPLVEVSTLDFNDIKLTILTAKRRGLLLEMIRAGISTELPEPKWLTSTSYAEPHHKEGKEVLVFEEVLAGSLTLFGHTLPSAIPQRMVDAGLVFEGKHHVDSEDLWVRVSDVFISPFIQQWRAGKFSTTLLMSEFGPGSRVFLRQA